VYALNFLYFFVDDEGIPFVYAQHLLKGQGLTYSSFEGPTEGYSDLLHVGIAALVLDVVRRAGWPKLTVFFIGKALSLLAGVAIILLGFLTIQRSPRVVVPGAMAGMALLALAGPLAQWSCSSLEAVPFALLIAGLLFALAAGQVDRAPERFDRLAVVAAALAVLERIDGPIYVGALVGAFAVCSAAPRRAELVRRVILPLLGVLVVYHAWRGWYFRDLLPLPFYAKVLYKLRPSTQVVVKSPAVPYAVRFVQVYGWMAVILFLAAGVNAGWRERAARPLLLALGILWVYLSIVGDWMSGFRFFIPLLPLLAVLLAHAVSVLFADRRAGGWAAAMTVVIWCGLSAASFERAYEQTENRPSWLHHPSLERGRFFGAYYGLLEAATRPIGLQGLVAYDQAGFVPFLLDLENIDTLGICSRFYAKLPSTDVFFTEVGRYAPLTGKRSIRAAEAYLLYRDVPVVIGRGDLMRNANQGEVPAELMGGYYKLLSSTQGDVIYRRTDRDAAEYKTNPRLFLENLAHPSYLRSAWINDRKLTPPQFKAAFPFLHDGTDTIEFRGTYAIELQLAETDVPVYELDVNAIRATAPIIVRLELESSRGVVRHRETLDVAAQTTRDVFHRLPEGVPTSRVRLEISGPLDQTVRVRITDLRVQGQTPALQEYIRKTLTFPAR
jgi:hypothetical protein